MDDLEQRIEAVNAALERGDLERAATELKACDLDRLLQSKSVSPRLKAVLDRTLEAAHRARAMREAELLKLAAEQRSRLAKDADEKLARAGIALRLAGRGDHAIIVALMKSLFDEVAPGAPAEESKRLVDADIALALTLPDVRIVLAEQSGAAIGVARVDISTAFPTFRMREDKRCGYIDQMFVQRGFRKLGLGKRMLGMCEEWLRERGIPYCMLHAAPNALTFYGPLGYQTTRELFKKL